MASPDLSGTGELRAGFARAVDQATAHLARDGFVAYPTETLWGLGACADRPLAVERLVRWKGRGSDAPIAVLVSSVEGAIDFGCRFGEAALRLAKAYWPGPLTLVVPCTGHFAPGIARADGALGLRCSPHPVAHALALAVADAGLGPLTATSLNRTGESPAPDARVARALVAERRAGESGETGDEISRPLWLEGLVDGPGFDAGGGDPSSVVDCTGPEPEILRCGAIARDALERSWTN